MGIDTTRISEQINLLWDQYGQAAILATVALAVTLTGFTVVKLARSRQRDRWIAGLTALVVLAWTSEGLWEVAYLTLGLPLAFSAVTFFVYEAMMLTSALQAEQHRRRHGTPGPAGRYVWLLASLTATIVALNASTLVEATLRFTLPLAAAGLWWISITAERDNEPAEVTARRAALAARRAATWAITPRSVLVAAGIMRPGLNNVTDAERERRIRQMVRAADRLHTTPGHSWRARRATARLRKHARLASSGDIAEVRARVARTTHIVELVLPDQHPTPVDPPTTGTDQGTARPSNNPAPGGGVKVPTSAWRTAQWVDTWIRMCADGDLVHRPITDNNHARDTYGVSARHLNNIRRAAASGALRDRAHQLQVPLPPNYVDDPTGGRHNGKAPASP